MKKLKVLVLLGVVALSLAACKKEEPANEPETKQEAGKRRKRSRNRTSRFRTGRDSGESEPFAGIPDLSDAAIGKRPVAVMVNNVMPAMPQYGVEEADRLFEIPVEGDVTRFMALYADYTAVPKVCAVRSCRYYFPVFSEGFGTHLCKLGN